MRYYMIVGAANGRPSSYSEKALRSSPLSYAALSKSIIRILLAIC